jgi:polyisoprenoid-binding protein YceI
MNTHSFAKLSATVFLLALLSACAPAPAAAPAAPEATAAPTAASTVAPTQSTTTETTTETTTTESSASTVTTTAAALPTGQVTYVIDPNHSEASYMVNEEFFGLAMPKYGIAAGLSDTVGRTSAIKGQFDINWDDLSKPLGDNTVVVDLSTLKSNQPLRDSWIRDNGSGPQFGAHPSATFTADTIEGGPTTYTPGEPVSFKVSGQLTVREVTKPATWDVTAVMQDGVISGTATTNLKMTDFGITPPNFANTLTVQDDFKVKLAFQTQK